MATKAVNLTNDFEKYKTVMVWADTVAVENLGLVALMITGRLTSGSGSVMNIWCRGDTWIGNGRATVRTSLQSALRLKLGS